MVRTGFVKEKKGEELRVCFERPDACEGCKGCSKGFLPRQELLTVFGRAEVGDVKRLSADVTSGEIHLALGRTDELSASTTSGDIDVRGDAAQKASLSSTSGKIGVSLAAFDALEIEATSGDITVALPAEPGYRADIHTTSGKFDYTVPLARDGDTYTCGDGSASLSIHVTSGDVRLTDIGE